MSYALSPRVVLSLLILAGSSIEVFILPFFVYDTAIKPKPGRHVLWANKLKCTVTACYVYTSLPIRSRSRITCILKCTRSTLDFFLP